MLIACPSCKRQLNVPDHAAGKQVRCPAPDCGTVFYAPTAATAPAVAAPPAPPKPVGKPGAALPPAAPFDFGPSAPVSGPEADFGFTEHTDGGVRGIGLRTRLSRAAGWLSTSAGSMVLFTLYLLSLTIA